MLDDLKTSNAAKGRAGEWQSDSVVYFESQIPLVGPLPPGCSDRAGRNVYPNGTLRRPRKYRRPMAIITANIKYRPARHQPRRLLVSPDMHEVRSVFGEGRETAAVNQGMMLGLERYIVVRQDRLRGE